MSQVSVFQNPRPTFIGIFFQQQTVEGLSEAVQQMEARHLEFQSEDFQENVQRFSRERYKEQMASAIVHGYEQWRRQRGAVLPAA